MIEQIPNDILYERGRLRDIYKEATYLGDRNICVLATAAYLARETYQGIRSKLVIDHKLRTPISGTKLVTGRGKILHSALILRNLLLERAGMELLPPPAGKGFLFEDHTWPICMPWMEDELRDLTGIVIVYDQRNDGLHITPVLRGWSLDHFSSCAQKSPVRCKPVVGAHSKLEVVYAKHIPGIP